MTDVELELRAALHEVPAPTLALKDPAALWVGGRRRRQRVFVRASVATSAVTALALLVVAGLSGGGGTAARLTVDPSPTASVSPAAGDGAGALDEIHVPTPDEGFGIGDGGPAPASVMSIPQLSTKPVLVRQLNFVWLGKDFSGLQTDVEIDVARTSDIAAPDHVATGTVEMFAQSATAETFTADRGRTGLVVTAGGFTFLALVEATPKHPTTTAAVVDLVESLRWVAGTSTEGGPPAGYASLDPTIAGLSDDGAQPYGGTGWLRSYRKDHDESPIAISDVPEGQERHFPPQPGSTTSAVTIGSATGSFEQPASGPGMRYVSWTAGGLYYVLSSGPESTITNDQLLALARSVTPPGAAVTTPTESCGNGLPESAALKALTLPTSVPGFPVMSMPPSISANSFGPSLDFCAWFFGARTTDGKGGVGMFVFEPRTFPVSQYAPDASGKIHGKPVGHTTVLGTDAVTLQTRDSSGPHVTVYAHVGTFFVDATGNGSTTVDDVVRVIESVQGLH